MRFPVLPMLLSIVPLFMHGQNCLLDLEFEVVYSGFSSPVDISYAPGDSSRLFIVERSGIIKIIKDGVVLSDPFLDIGSSVSSGGERGLLGLAFAPDYQSSGRLYVNYTNNSGDTRIARFQVSAQNPDSVAASSQEILLEIGQPQANHNAGDLLFGPDGLLYIPMGDGGGQGDPNNLSQDSSSLLGKLLRIDVDTPHGYKIPSDNPFLDNPAVPDEIWAIGFRNPWRASFDRHNGNLWIADVGQNSWEEVNVQLSGTGGGANYGWRCYEGNAPYNTTGCGDQGLYTFPVLAIDHDFSEGGFSITGGYVYRGNAYNALKGKYVCADYVTANVFVVEDSSGIFVSRLLDDIPIVDVSTFGEDYYGAIYAASLTQGDIYLVRPTNLDLNEPIIQSGSYCSPGSLFASGTVEPNGNVSFTAFDRVILESGFEINIGSELTIDISD